MSYKIELSAKELIEHNDPIIAVGIIFYNAKEELKRCLLSFIDNCRTVDYIFLIDGAFKFNRDKGTSLLSDDGSREYILNEYMDIARQHKINVVLDDSQAGKTEFDKRQRYLELCKLYNCNALFIVDSDEFVYESPEHRFNIKRDWNTFRQELKQYLLLDHNVFSIDTMITEKGQLEQYPRIWLKPHEMAYIYNSHYKFIKINETDPFKIDVQNHFDRQGTYKKTIKGIILKHDHNKRTMIHFNEREKYQKFLISYERYLENGYSVQQAETRANYLPSNTDISCYCKACAKIRGIDPDIIFDARPKNKRTWNPYE